MWIIRLFFLPSLHLTDSKRGVVNIWVVVPYQMLIATCGVEA